MRLISGHRNTIILEKVYDGRKPEDLHAKFDALRLWPDKETVEKWMLRAYLTAWNSHELDAL